MDWPSEIVKGVIIHQRLAELDVAGLWHYHLPEVAASEDEIAATEQNLGYRFDAQYREFLRYANGWRSFFQDIDVMGTKNLLGDGVMRNARAQLAAIEPDLFLSDVGLEVGDMLPIGASDVQTDMFLIGQPWSKEPGVVVWFAGYTIARFPNDRCLRSVVEERLSIGAGQRAGPQSSAAVWLRNRLGVADWWLSR